MKNPIRRREQLHNITVAVSKEGRGNGHWRWVTMRSVANRLGLVPSTHIMGLLKEQVKQGAIEMKPGTALSGRACLTFRYIPVHKRKQEINF